jgi:hypothetical protein
MSRRLRRRAAKFLKRPVPEGLRGQFASDSITERIIARHAEAGDLGEDVELHELLSFCTVEASEAVERHEGETRDHFRETFEILQAIEDESHG